VKQREKGQVQALDENTECDFYLHAMETLEQAGFEHYEISNFARPGFACRHNQVYWANHAYFGFGVGAARYMDGVRELNTRDLRSYIRRLQEGRSPTFQSERLQPRERAVETLVIHLRRGSGVERASFQEQTGFCVDLLAGPKLRELAELELLRDEGPGFRLTRRGKCLADAIASQIMAAAQ